MFYLDSNNNKYYIGRSFTYGDYQYNRSAATHDKFIELGFTQVTIQTKPNSTFYIVSGPDLTGAYTSTPRDLGELKEKFVRDTKLASRQLLSKTDWLVIRKEENGNAIPAEIETFRDQVRTIADSNCSLINACADVAALESLINSPPVIEDPNSPGYFINNPTAHLDLYPEEVSGYDY